MIISSAQAQRISELIITEGGNRAGLTQTKGDRKIKVVIKNGNEIKARYTLDDWGWTVEGPE